MYKTHSRHILILGPKCLMYFSADLSETLLCVHWTLRHQMNTSAPTQKCETLWHQTHSAEMPWVRSVLGPKCPYTGTTNCSSMTSFLLSRERGLQYKQHGHETKQSHKAEKQITFFGRSYGF